MTVGNFHRLLRRVREEYEEIEVSRTKKARCAWRRRLFWSVCTWCFVSGFYEYSLEMISGSSSPLPVYRVVWCFLSTRWIVGRYGVRQMFAASSKPLDRPAFLGALFLAIPVLFVVAYTFVTVAGEEPDVGLGQP